MLISCKYRFVNVRRGFSFPVRQASVRTVGTQWKNEKIDNNSYSVYNYAYNFLYIVFTNDVFCTKSHFKGCSLCHQVFSVSGEVLKLLLVVFYY